MDNRVSGIIYFLIITSNAVIYCGASEMTVDWSNWSDWSRTGSCIGTLGTYERSRTCTSNSLSVSMMPTPAATVAAAACTAGQVQSQLKNDTVSSCADTSDDNTSAVSIALGITLSIALLFIVIGVVLCILSMRLWVKRQSYNIREAQLNQEHLDNIPVYHNVRVGISPSQTMNSLSNSEQQQQLSEQQATTVSTTAGATEDDDHNEVVQTQTTNSLSNGQQQQQQREQQATTTGDDHYEVVQTPPSTRNNTVEGSDHRPLGVNEGRDTDANRPLPVHNDNMEMTVICTLKPAEDHDESCHNEDPTHHSDDNSMTESMIEQATGEVTNGDTIQCIDNEPVIPPPTTLSGQHEQEQYIGGNDSNVNTSIRHTNDESVVPTSNTLPHDDSSTDENTTNENSGGIITVEHDELQVDASTPPPPSYTDVLAELQDPPEINGVDNENSSTDASQSESDSDEHSVIGKENLSIEQNGAVTNTEHPDPDNDNEFYHQF